MVKTVQKTELEKMLKLVHDYCEERDIPIFLASWQPPETPEDTGYIYEYLPPACLDMNMEELTGKKDKFPLFLKIVAGRLKL